MPLRCFLTFFLSLPDAVKVLSIFGNTGDGKSFTLNHTFFGGENVFLTSSSQAAGTFGKSDTITGAHKKV